MDTTIIKARAAALRQQRPGMGELTGGKLSSLIKISQALARAMTLDELLELVAREVNERQGADQTFLLLKDAQGRLHIRAEFGRDGAPNRMAVSGTICEAVLATGEEILIPEALTHPSFQSQESVVALNLRSVMAAPLKIGDDPASGVIYACSYTTGELFGQADLELFKAFAAQVAIHLDRTLALAEKDRLLGELAAVAASRGRVVEVATHELGTPLTQAALGLAVAKKLVEKIKGGEDFGELSRAVEAHLYELQAMLQSALDGINGVNTRFIEPLRRYYDLELLLDRLTPRLITAETLEMMLKKWARLANGRPWQLFETLPVGLKADPDLLDRAVTHLLENAVAYSPPGSPLAVRAERRDNWLLITVEDQGMGIPPADLPHVGTWLYRGDNVANLATVKPGLGIGLHAARRIAQAHGGRLDIESALGQGTRVTLALPALVG